jgi:hypothetical protein
MHWRAHGHTNTPYARGIALPHNCAAIQTRVEPFCHLSAFEWTRI